MARHFAVASAASQRLGGDTHGQCLGDGQSRLAWDKWSWTRRANEITAIPKLLQILEISGCLVTIDAMGCQTEIAKEIVNAGADYVLAVKGNQPTLHEGI